MPEHETEGYFALPAAGTGRACWCCTPVGAETTPSRPFCRRLSAEGFTAYAPDLYHGQVVSRVEDAERLSSTLDLAGARAEVAAAAELLARRAAEPAHGLAVVGFSLGAFFALDLSAAAPERVRQVVVFYGTGPADNGRAQAAYPGHFAANDPFEPQENVAWLERTLQEAGRPATFYHYPGTGHWFFEADRSDAYDAAAAALAWRAPWPFSRARRSHRHELCRQEARQPWCEAAGSVKASIMCRHSVPEQVILVHTRLN
jgi:carboxymethylenebutenolidase